ncbi:hypothetical protein E3N88_25804 [Mikania micrantha]|uniref:Uncharacterized protein n=1 Tax=Mikania micrantha TaxID=192012 RepID=A0A5N6N5S1_9ASTR|nr:hypothetical protein E3N88_25804 [Mikania micrantha]
MLSTTCSIMKSILLPQNFWEEAVRHTIYVLNRIPTKALKDDTPFEALKGRKPFLKHQKVFGCIAYAKVPPNHLTNLDDRSVKMVYLGVEERSKAYRQYDPIREETEWIDFTIDYNLIETSQSEITPLTTEEDLIGNNDQGYQNPITPVSPFTLVTPPTCFKDLNEVYERFPEVESNEMYLAQEEPHNYKEAAEDKKWIEAMQAEIDSINKNNTWKFTKLPDGHKEIGLKWVFMTKRDANGTIIKHKAHLVAKGYVQEHGRDFDEVFAPVAHIETVHLLLALAAHNGWEVHHLDVKSAFLHGKLKEEVYVSQPEGFVKTHDEGKVYKLSKALGDISIKQSGYITKMLKNAGIIDSNETKIPMNPGTLLTKTGDGKLVDATQYRILIGCLRNGRCKLTIYSDSSYGVKTEEGKCSTGMELWLKRLLSELTGWKEEKITLYVDNISTIAWMKSPVFHGRINPKCVDNEHIIVEHISGELQRVDILTKALARIKFTTMRELLGVQDLYVRD